MNPFDLPQVPANSPASALSRFDRAFESAATVTRNDLPDGKYSVRVERVTLETSRKGDPMLRWDLIVLAGAFAGRHVFKNAVITDATLMYVKSDLKLLGLELGRLSDLPVRLEELLDQQLEISRRTRGEHTNVYFNKLLPPPEGAPHPAPEAPPTVPPAAAGPACAGPQGLPNPGTTRGGPLPRFDVAAPAPSLPPRPGFQLPRLAPGEDRESIPF